MKSKIKDYQDTYNQYQYHIRKVSEIEQPISGIQEKIEECQALQKGVDFRNPSVLLSAMEEYVENEVKETESKLEKEVADEISKIEAFNQQFSKKIKLVLSWLSPNKCEKILNKANIYASGTAFLETAERDKKLSIVSIINTIFAYVFRFKFLKFLPRVFQVIVGIIVWAILLVLPVYKAVYAGYDAKYRDYLFGLDGTIYDQERVRILSEFARTTIVVVVLIACLLVLVNIVAFIYGKLLATKYVRDYPGIFKVYYNAQDFKCELYEKKFELFKKEKVSLWKDEIRQVRENNIDIDNADIKLSLFTLVRDSLKTKYERIEDEIRSLTSKIHRIEEVAAHEKSKADILIPELEGKANSFTQYIVDDDYNNWVLSPYVSVGYSKNTTASVKELISFEHNYKPIVICFSEETKEKGERFRKNTAHLIELFMNGFFWENNYELINMWLVNFGGLHFPKSRTQGLMTVIDSQQELQGLYDELKKTSSIVNGLGDGKIQNVNPIRKQDREQPIKYNVVFFVGNNLKAIETEISQLFIRGENFGFLPIIFLNQSEMKTMLEDKSMTREFSDVLKMAKENDQIYSYEGIVSEFEYSLIVSEQKEELLEKLVYVDRIMTFDEFWELGTSDEGITCSDTLYVDTYNMPRDLYEAIKEDVTDYVLFTTNNEIPDYVPSDDVIKLFEEEKR